VSSQTYIKTAAEGHGKSIGAGKVCRDTADDWKTYTCPQARARFAEQCVRKNSTPAKTGGYGRAK